MTLRSDFERAQPRFPLLAVGDVECLTSYLASRGWLAPGEEVQSCDQAGDGNMNLTLRVVTDRQRFVLKQARPWVEKYDDIEAPLSRASFERKFYDRVKAIPSVADRMPALLHADEDACVLVLEDVGEGADLTITYQEGVEFDRDALGVLADYLSALHQGTRFGSDVAGRAAAADFDNREMRLLNHAHIFVVPLDDSNGLPLDDLAPGLALAADVLRRDAVYRKLVLELAAHYLEPDAGSIGTGGVDGGACLLHGDFFPGSWLASASGLRIIDPEFSFAGPREIDVACVAAHLALGGQTLDTYLHFRSRCESGSEGSLDRALESRYAAVEVMRRLIGVAQLPLPKDNSGSRAALLARSRQAMVEADVEALFR